MDEIFLLQNQDKLFLSKQKEWVDGRDLGSLFKTRHKDEALNQLFEVNAKDFSQRIQVLACPSKPNGLPQIQAEDMPAPILRAEQEKEENPPENDEAKADTEIAEFELSEPALASDD